MPIKASLFKQVELTGKLCFSADSAANCVLLQIHRKSRSQASKKASARLSVQTKWTLTRLALYADYTFCIRIVNQSVQFKTRSLRKLIFVNLNLCIL